MTRTDYTIALDWPGRCNFVTVLWHGQDRVVVPYDWQREAHRRDNLRANGLIAEQHFCTTADVVI